MNIEELKTQIETYRGKLENASGKMIIGNGNGPITMEPIDILVAVIADQQAKIQALEAKLDSLR